MKRGEFMKQLEIFDSTLRDGAQSEGISFSVHDKINIVHALDEFGIAYIEGGKSFFQSERYRIF